MRGSLAWVRETELRGWRPGLTFGELEAWIRGWPSLPSGSGPGALVVTEELMQVALDGLEDARARLAAERGDVAHAAGVIRDFILQRLDGRAGAGLAVLRTVGRFDKERDQLVLAYTQAVRDRAATQVAIPGCGEFDVVTLACVAPGELVPELAGDPVPVPLLHAVLRIGPSAQLWTAPARNLGWRITDLRENTTATVEGLGVLVKRGASDATGDPGDWWLYVRTGGGAYGWLYGGGAAWNPLDEGITRVVAGQRALDPALLAERVVALANEDEVYDWRPNVLDVRPKIVNTVNDVHLLAGGPHALVDTFRAALRRRLFEETEAVFSRHPASPKKLFAGLGEEEQRAFWAQLAADLKCQFYFPRVLTALMPVFTALLAGDFAGAARAGAAFLARMRDATEEELLRAGDEAAPPLLELIQLLFDLIKQIVTGIGKVAEAGKEAASTTKDLVDKRIATGKRSSATRTKSKQEVAEDDEQREAEKRWRSRWADFKAKVKARGLDTPTRSIEDEGLLLAREKVRLELPRFIARHIPEEDLTRARDAGQEAWRRKVGDEHFEQTKDKSDEERERYMVELAWRQRAGEEEWQRYEALTPAERDAFMEQQAGLERDGQGGAMSTRDFSYTTCELWPPNVGVGRHFADGEDHATLIERGDDETQVGRLHGRHGAVTYDASLFQQTSSDDFGAGGATEVGALQVGVEGDGASARVGVVGFRKNDDGTTLGEVGVSAEAERDGATLSGSAAASLFSTEDDTQSFVNVAAAARYESGDLTLTGAARVSGAAWDDGALTLGPGQLSSGFSYGKQKESSKQLWEKTLSLTFGDDTLSFTYSCEEGAGAGAGTEVGSGTTANVTGSVRLHGYALKIPVRTLLSFTEGGVVFLRLGLRTLVHLCDAIDALVAWIERDVAAPGSAVLLDPERLVPLVFAGFAFIEALRDVVGDHPDFVVKVLEEVNTVVQLDANGALAAGVSIGGEIHEAVTIKAAMKLATIAAPLLDLLDGGRAKIDEVATAGERIVPEVRIDVADHTVLKGAYFPYGVEIHSRGRLAHARVAIPPGSSIRENARAFWGWIADMAETFKARRTIQVAPGQPDPRPTAQLRSLLAAVDRGLVNVVMPALENPTDPTAWMSSSPSVSALVAKLRGESTAALAGTPSVDAQVAAAMQAFADTGATGVALQTGRLLVAEPVGQGFMQVSVYLSEADKRALDRWSSPEHPGGLPAPVPPAPSVEVSRYRVRLPAAPVRVGWNSWVDPYGEHRRVGGIIAGFDSNGAARAFAAARDGAWVEGAFRDKVFPREGKHWAWLETGMEALLEVAECPLPALELASSELTLTFHAAPFEGPKKSGSPLLADDKLVSREIIWRRVLLTRATRTDYLQLWEVLERNLAARGG